MAPGLINSRAFSVLTAYVFLLAAIVHASIEAKGAEAQGATDERSSQASTLYERGRALIATDPTGAIANFQQALTLFREVGDRRGEGRTLAHVAFAYGALN